MIETAHRTTAPEDRIPLLQKLAYAVGMFVNNLQAAALPAMVVILNLGLGMDPVLVGLIGSIPRIFDAITDPMMGYISDNARTRWGRRRPFILVGALSAGLIFALMWQLPAGHSQVFYFWTFLGASIAFFGAYTVYATPFVAFGYEMTPDYHERTRLQAFANWIGQIPWIIVPWFYAIMANKTLFRDTVHGARTLAIFVGILVALLGIFPALLCRERYASLAQQAAAGFWKNLLEFFRWFKLTFQCRPFLKLCAATFLVFNGFQLGSSFSLYVMKYYVYAGADDPDKLAGNLQGSFGTLSSICTLCIIPLITWLSTRIGKRRAFTVTISLSIVGYGLKWIGYNPDHPYWLLFAAPFVSFGIGSLFTLISSMVADVCDYDELTSHQRREGMFGAIYWWMVKIGMAVAALLGGIMLKVSGFDVAVQNAQPANTLFFLRLFDVGVPALTSLAAIFVMMTYEITEKRAREIRGELERRRGTLGQEAALQADSSEVK
jgi:GPH family glycoside/pentoside/hexuronide:cation symporter